MIYIRLDYACQRSYSFGLPISGDLFLVEALRQTLKYEARWSKIIGTVISDDLEWGVILGISITYREVPMLKSSVLKVYDFLCFTYKSKISPDESKYNPEVEICSI